MQSQRTAIVTCAAALALPLIFSVPFPSVTGQSSHPTTTATATATAATMTVTLVRTRLPLKRLATVVDGRTVTHKLKSGTPWSTVRTSVTATRNGTVRVTYKVPGKKVSKTFTCSPVNNRHTTQTLICGKNITVTVKVPLSWKQIYREDFLTPAALGTVPTVYQRTLGAYPYPWTDTSRNLRSNPGYYNPERTLAVSDNVLTANLHYDTQLHKYLVAAPQPKLTSRSPYGVTYGRFVVRMRADTTPGYKVAFLLWPDSDKWPSGGEVDFPEGSLNNSTMSAFHHHANPSGEQEGFTAGATANSWHTYETEWTADHVIFRIDGRTIGSSTKHVPSTPMHWVLQMETEVSRAAPSINVAGRVQIDWLSVSQLQ